MSWIFDHTETRTIDLTYCDNQDSPSVPSADYFVQTSDEIRNPRWSTLYKNTDERQIQYKEKQSGQWLDNWTRIGTSDFITNWGD